MLWPILITGGILGGIAAFAPRVTPSVPTPTPPPTPTTGPMPDVSSVPPTGRTIRIDPDFTGTIRARVGDTISMHGVSRRSTDNLEGYYFTPRGFVPPGTLFTLPVAQDQNAPADGAMLREEGPNDFRVVYLGTFTIRWAPNHVVTVEVSP